MKDTIKENREFRYAYKRGKKVVSGLLVLHYYRNRTSENKLGITVSKTIGKATVRNHVKRLIRECYREKKDTLKSGYNIVIVARLPMVTATYKEAAKAFDYCIRKSELI